GGALRARETFRLKRRLLTEVGIAVADITAVGSSARKLPKRIVCRVLASGAQAATLRAVNYATTLQIENTNAVNFAYDHEQASQLRLEWHNKDFDLPLEIVEAPFRELGDPLLRYLRGLTAESETLCVVVMPEIVIPGWRELLHNQRALYVKRALLFEP